MTIEEMKSRKTELGYSCEKLSELSGVPLGTVQKIFSGVTKRPRYATISALEGILKERSMRYDNFADNRKGLTMNEAAVRYNATAENKEESRSVLDDVAEGVWSRQGTYTVDDYLSLPDDVRVELIDGVFYEMYAPTAYHQIISMELSVEFSLFIRNNKGSCRVFAAPFDVHLDMDNKTMVQPDIVIICKPSGFTRERAIGAPDFVIEILSQSTKNKDMRLKLKKYENAGVREYWIIDPDARTIIVYNFEQENLTGMYTFNDEVPVGIWDGKCKIDFKSIARELDKAHDEIVADG